MKKSTYEIICDHVSLHLVTELLVSVTVTNEAAPGDANFANTTFSEVLHNLGAFGRISVQFLKMLFRLWP